MRLSQESMSSAAWMIGCDIPAIAAVAKVESGPYGGFLRNGDPVILFERHVFHALTGGQFGAAVAPSLSPEIAPLSSPRPSYRDRSYGPLSAQHVKLQAAAKLDRDAALKSCSWGLFQQLGRDQRYSSNVQDFINEIYSGVNGHLRCFVMFVMGDRRLVRALRSRDWGMFKVIYNGPDDTGRDYVGEMKAEYERLTKDGDVDDVDKCG